MSSTGSCSPARIYFLLEIVTFDSDVSSWCATVLVTASNVSGHRLVTQTPSRRSKRSTSARRPRAARLSCATVACRAGHRPIFDSSDLRVTLVSQLRMRVVIQGQAEGRASRVTRIVTHAGARVTADGRAKQYMYGYVLLGHTLHWGRRTEYSCACLTQTHFYSTLRLFFVFLISLHM